MPSVAQIKPQSGAPTAKRRKAYRRNELILAYLLVGPLFLWLAITILYPLVSAIHLSVLNVKVIGSGGDFVGLANYEQVLSNSKFWAALGRSAVWVIANAVLQTVVAFATALILKQQFRGRSIARVWIILSWIVPTVVVVIIWRWMLGTSGGIVNYLLVALGVMPQPIGFFSTGPGAFAALVFINSWRWFPLSAVIILAGMQSIPRGVLRSGGGRRGERLAAVPEDHLTKFAAGAVCPWAGGNTLVGQRLRHHLAADIGRSLVGNDHAPRVHLRYRFQTI